MSVAAFDTLKYARQLKKAGLPEEQADALTNALSDALHVGIQDLTTKNDLEKVRQELKTDIAATKNDLEKVRQELKADIAATKNDLEKVHQELKTDIEKSRLESKTDVSEARQETQQLRQEMKSEFALVRQEMKSEFALVRQEMKNLEGQMAILKWMCGILVPAVMALVVRMFFFPIH